MRPICALATCLTLVCVAATSARAANEAAAAHFKKGLAAYALGRYDEAAKEYEAAFDLEPQAPLLYDAAMAHRLAGNRERALLLYQNYLRIYPDAPKQEDVRRLIDMLQKAIAADRAAGNSPPVTPLPLTPKPNEPPGNGAATSAPPAPDATPSLTTSAPPPRKKRPAWVWGVVGGAAGVVVIGLAVGLSVGLSGTSYPSASMTVTLK